MERGSARIPQLFPGSTPAHSTLPKLMSQKTLKIIFLMGLVSFLSSCFCCSVLNGIESTGRWRGAGPARVWCAGAWQHLGQPPWPGHHQSLKNFEKPFRGKEGSEEIKDPVLYWEAVKNGVAKLAPNVPKRKGKLRGDQGAPCANAPCVTEPDLPRNNTKVCGLLKG